MADDTVFALHMPHGTAIEVPDPNEAIRPDGTKRYRCPTVTPIETYAPNLNPTLTLTRPEPNLNLDPNSDPISD